jgi:zinc-ribbon domain
MAFCNSCGATLDAGTKFCNKCGAAVAAPPLAASATPAAPMPPAQPAAGGSSALKIILIVIAIIVGLGIISVGAFSFFVYRVAKSARDKVHVTQEGDQVKIDSPLGSFSANNAEQATKDLGVDIYPGSQAEKNGNASVAFGNIHTVTASYESSDSLDKVCAFYKSKFPNAMTTSSDQNRCTIISNDPNGMITINIETNGDATKFQISNVNKKVTSN